MTVPAGRRRPVRAICCSMMARRPISSPAACDKHADGYGRWLGWLAETGRLDPDAAPAARVTRERIAAYVGGAAADQRAAAPCWAASPISPRCCAGSRPSRTGAGCGAIQARLRARVGTAPQDRKRARLRSAHELLALGLQLMDSAATRPRPVPAPARPAVPRRADDRSCSPTRPLRLANLVQLTLGRELVRRGEGLVARDPGRRHQDRRAARAALARGSGGGAGDLSRHLAAAARPRERSRLQALWLSNRGRGLSDQQVYSKIVAHTRTAFGQPVNPHLFRDAAATTIARDRPAAGPPRRPAARPSQLHHHRAPLQSRPGNRGRRPPGTTCSPTSATGNDG